MHPPRTSVRWPSSGARKSRGGRTHDTAVRDPISHVASVATHSPSHPKADIRAVRRCCRRDDRMQSRHVMQTPWWLCLWTRRTRRASRDRDPRNAETQYHDNVWLELSAERPLGTVLTTSLH
jgi:hypothetical protein